MRRVLHRSGNWGRACAMACLPLALAACISSDDPPVDPNPAATVSGTEAAATTTATYAPGTGPDPALPAPQTAAIPVVEIAPARRWEDGETPRPAAGYGVTAFARGLDHPRQLLVLPNGDVLVAESNRPPPKVPPDPKQIAMNAVMKRAGAGVPSADRVTLLRDADGDGVAEQRHVLLSGLTSPYGMALVGDTLYVANADALVRVPYRRGATSVPSPPEKVVDLPAGRNHHWTKSLAADAHGLLYVGVGSNSNVAEHGMQEEVDRAAVLRVDPKAKTASAWATGLRNPTALAFHPASRQLWAVVNERDELGNDLVPDYLTAVRRGAFYGWPYSYFGQHLDTRVQPQDPALVAKAVKPDYALGSHVAPLGLAFAQGDKPGAYIGLHGSWNRQPKVGYSVVFVPFADGRPSGPMQTVLDGFVDDKGDARGRPVGVAMDARGGLLVADDVGNAIWRVSPNAGGAAEAGASR